MNMIQNSCFVPKNRRTERYLLKCSLIYHVYFMKQLKGTLYIYETGLCMAKEKSFLYTAVTSYCDVAI